MYTNIMVNNINMKGEIKMADVTIKIKSVKHETDMAWLAILEDGSEVWFPKSQCSLKENSLLVPDWLVEAKNISN